MFFKVNVAPVKKGSKQYFDFIDVLLQAKVTNYCCLLPPLYTNIVIDLS